MRDDEALQRPGPTLIDVPIESDDPTGKSGLAISSDDEPSQQRDLA